MTDFDNEISENLVGIDLLKGKLEILIQCGVHGSTCYEFTLGETLEGVHMMTALWNILTPKVSVPAQE